jgi:uncharacterized membrane protein HdeD (DUF308 family)
MSHHIMARFWWILVGRGAFGLLLGSAALTAGLYLSTRPYDPYGLSLLMGPVSTMVILLLLLGLYAFMDGIFSIVLGAQDFGNGRRWWTLQLEGFLSIALGVWTWMQPDPAVKVLFYWIAIWALISGISEVLQAFDHSEYRDRRAQFLMAGICSLAFGALVILFPTGAVRMVWLTGIYSFIFGFAMMAMGFRLRLYAKRFQALEGMGRPA